MIQSSKVQMLGPCPEGGGGNFDVLSKSAHNWPGRWVSPPKKTSEWDCRSPVTKNRSPIFLANQ